MNNLQNVLNKKRNAIRTIYVSSYIPRKCGIATFTKDLTNAINLLNPRALAEIMVMSRPGESIVYPWEAKFKINQDELPSYLQAASYINQSGTDLVSLQHEFGIFGGQMGEYIIPFVQSLNRPLVTTLHTVLENPNTEGGTIIKRLVRESKVVVVMMEKIKNKLVRDYDAPPEKIISIPHGTPDLPLISSEIYKKKRQLSNRIVLGNINLLTPSRGVEYTIQAVATIAKKFPNVLYLIIGQTHPVYFQTNGEDYRNYLKKEIRRLGIEKNIRFINEYISLDELIGWLKTIDFYITPYLDPQQAASGALAYAVGAGKCCISTPYLYAQEVLAKGRGVIVPFRNSEAIAKAVIDLWEQPEKKGEIEKKAYAYGRLMTWSNVALQYFDLFRTILNSCKTEKNGKE